VALRAASPIGCLTWRWLLPPDHRDPERFHLEKSELGDELRRVAHDAQRRLAD
jgi:hypothetical protein